MLLDDFLSLSSVLAGVSFWVKVFFFNVKTYYVNYVQKWHQRTFSCEISAASKGIGARSSSVITFSLKSVGNHQERKMNVKHLGEQFYVTIVKNRFRVHRCFTLRCCTPLAQSIIRINRKKIVQRPDLAVIRFRRHWMLSKLDHTWLRPAGGRGKTLMVESVVSFRSWWRYDGLFTALLE